MTTKNIFTKTLFQELVSKNDTLHREFEPKFVTQEKRRKKMVAKMVSFQKKQNLSIVQIATDNQNSFSYISGPSAIKDNLIEVTEVSESGSVNMLQVLNLSDKFVFMMDGDILAGAKQNRVLNTSVLLAPNSKTQIPVSCVERGRWSHISEKFHSTDYTAPSFMRAKKAFKVSENLKKGVRHLADQAEVWEDVNFYSLKFNIKSRSDNLSDIFNGKRKDLDEFIEFFKPDKSANGLAVFVKNSLLSLDVFNLTEIYSEYFQRIVKGCAIEAFGLEGNSQITEAEAKFKALTFIDQFGNFDFEEHSGVGVGTEKRFRSDDMTGFELVYNSNMIHLTALNLKKES